MILRLAGIVLFVVVLARTDMGEMWMWLKNINGWWILMAFVFQVLLLLFKCIRWLWLNENRFAIPAIYQRFGEFLEAYAVGVITPGRMGELLKAGHAKGKANVVSSGLLVIAERGLDLSLFFLMAGLALGFGYLKTMGQATGYVLMLVALAGIVLSYAILTFPGVVGLVELILKKIRLISPGQSLTFIHRKGRALGAFTVLSLVSNLSAFVSFYFIALAVSISLGFMSVSGSVALAGVINTIPVTIMGVGTRDVTLLYVLSEIPKSQVLAFSGLILLVSQIGGGIIALVSGQYFLYKAKRFHQKYDIPANKTD